MVPRAKIAGRMVHRLCAAKGKTSSTSVLQARIQATARRRRRSNSQPPALLPTMQPAPNTPMARGIQPGPTWVTWSNVGAM